MFELKCSILIVGSINLKKQKENDNSIKENS
jgi:hypothetical protein